jgi:hypothetical protein
VSIIFAQMLPSIDINNVALVAAVAFVIFVNAVVSHWFAMRGTQWRSLAREFAAMAAVNLAAGLVYLFLLPGRADDFDIAAPLFFTLLLTLIVTLYDRYRPIHDARMVIAAEPATQTLPADGELQPEGSVAS